MILNKLNRKVCPACPKNKVCPERNIYHFHNGKVYRRPTDYEDYFFVSLNPIDFHMIQINISNTKEIIQKTKIY